MARSNTDDPSSKVRSAEVATSSVQFFGNTHQSKRGRQPVLFCMTDPVWLPTAGGGGCCIADVQFPAPTSVAELTFQNFYTANMDLLVCTSNGLPTPTGAGANAASSQATAPGSRASETQLCSTPSRVVVRRASSSAVAADRTMVGEAGEEGMAPGSSSRQEESKAAAAAAVVAGAAGAKGEGGAASGLEPEAAEFLRSLGLDLEPTARQSVTWSLSVRRKQLMPNPHYETGSQDRYSVTSKESRCPWNDLLVMRLVLRQPSPSWTVFGVAGVKVYRDLPPTVSSPQPGCSRDRDGVRTCPLLQAVRRQTDAALACVPGHRVPKPLPYSGHPSAYEFFQLPRV